MRELLFPHTKLSLIFNTRIAASLQKLLEPTTRHKAVEIIKRKKCAGQCMCMRWQRLRESADPESKRVLHAELLALDLTFDGRNVSDV